MTASEDASTPGAPSRLGTPAQKEALTVGAVFLLVGLLGFVPGITANCDRLTLAGLHFEALAIAMIALGTALGRAHSATGRPIRTADTSPATTPR